MKYTPNRSLQPWNRNQTSKPEAILYKIHVTEHHKCFNIMLSFNRAWIAPLKSPDTVKNPILVVKSDYLQKKPGVFVYLIFQLFAFNPL